MTDTTLKQRLDALRVEVIKSRAADPWVQATCEVDLELALKEAFFTDQIVTKEELEAAVAKAVAKEREACAWVAHNACVPAMDVEGSDKGAVRACNMVRDLIRARGESE